MLFKDGAPYLKNITGEIKFLINKLKINNFVFSPIETHIDLTEKIATISHKEVIASGDFMLSLLLKLKRDNQWDFTSQLSLKNASASEIIRSFKPQAGIKQGKFHINFDGKSTGSNFNALRSHLKGKGLLQIDNLTIEKYAIDARYVDLLDALWQSFIPRASKQETLIECAAIRFNIHNGKLIAKEKIGIQTAELYSLGSGVVDLNNQHINFIFKIYPRSQVNLEVGSYNNTVALKGTWQHPKIIASVEGVVKEGGSLLLGFATGGVSLIAEKLMKVVTQQRSPCQQVLNDAK